jgi:hypothetical protein
MVLLKTSQELLPPAPFPALTFLHAMEIELEAVESGELRRSVWQQARDKGLDPDGEDGRFIWNIWNIYRQHREKEICSLLEFYEADIKRDCVCGAKYCADPHCMDWYPTNNCRACGRETVIALDEVTTEVMVRHLCTDCHYYWEKRWPIEEPDMPY